MSIDGVSVIVVRAAPDGEALGAVTSNCTNTLTTTLPDTVAEVAAAAGLVSRVGSPTLINAPPVAEASGVVVGSAAGKALVAVPPASATGAAAVNGSAAGKALVALPSACTLPESGLTVTVTRAAFTS